MNPHNEQPHYQRHDQQNDQHDHYAHYDYDVIIIGAGINGLTLACALSQAKLRCAVIETRDRPDKFDPQSPYHLRVSAITRASENIFRHLQLWPDIVKHRHCPYFHLKIIDEATQSAVAFSANTVAQPNLGMIIENDIITTAVFEKIARDPNVALHFNCSASEVTLTPVPTVILQNDLRFTAKLLVGADGARSTLRAQVGLSINEQSYGQSAIVATVHTEKKHDFTARQIFLQHGPLAFLPLADEHLSSIVWSHQTKQAQTLSQLDDAAFNTVLTKAFSAQLGSCAVRSQRVTFPLQQMHAQQYFKPGVVLLGDAAHTIHPLAGQGLNLGLLDVACLAEVLQQAAAQNRPLASAATLRRYERQRRWHNGMVMQLMNGFHYGFTHTTSSPLVKLRALAMRVVNRSTFLQQTFIQQALGLSGPLPRLARWDTSLDGSW